MIFISIKGVKKKIKNPTKYLIDWDGECRSKFQFNVKQFLKPYWQYDVVFEELPVLGSRMSLDIYNASKKIAIEVDGDQHYSFNKFFHGSRGNFLSQIKRDDTKDSFCEVNDITLVRVLYKDKLSLDLFEKLGIVLKQYGKQ